MKKPIILVSMSVAHPQDKEPHNFVNLAYTQAIAQAGGVPVACPYQQAAELAQLADGLLLTGGEDLEPARYGEERLNDTVITTPARDDFEWELLALFQKNGKPVRGICRGFQLMNVFLGGSLYQDMPAQLDRNHSKLDHPATAQAASFWRQNFGQSFTVNSFHHQAVKELGQGLVTTVHAADGTVEAFETADGLWRACQWHPERMPQMAPFFQEFIEACQGAK